MLIDTHTHIFLEDFKDDIDEVLKRAIKNDVQLCFLPNIDTDSIDDLHSVCKKYPNICFPMMGLHPCSVKGDYKIQLKQIEGFLNNQKYYGVGETGIDLYWDKSYYKEQVISLETHIIWAKSLNLPIILHCRDSFNEVFDVISKLQDGTLTGVFHCFTGSVEDAKKVIDVGFLMGIGGVATFKNAGLDKSLKHISLEHLVLETDAPYLTPTPYRGKRNEPSHIKYIVEKLKDIYGLSELEIAERTTKNAKLLFKLN